MSATPNVPDEIRSPEDLDAIARELGVTWPDWYRRIVLALLAAGEGILEAQDYLCASPEPILRDTQRYRERPSECLYPYDESWLGGPRESIPWPHSYVIVGNVGGGEVVIDTASNEPVLHIYDLECLWLRPEPWLRIAEDKTPEDIARVTEAHIRERWRKNAEEARASRAAIAARSAPPPSRFARLLTMLGLSPRKGDRT